MEKNAALRDLEFIRSLVFSAREGAKHNASYLLLWGVIWLIGYLLPVISTYGPVQEGVHWSILGPLGGVISYIIGLRQARGRGKVPFLLKVVFWSWTVMAGFGLVLMLYFLRQAAPAAVYSFWPLLVGACYLVGGMVLGREMLGLGALLVVMSLVGFQLSATGQAWLYGLGGGGILLLSGLALRRGARADERPYSG